MTRQAPATIRTERLVLRAWRPGDAPLLKDAVDSSLDHLRAWLPWAAAEPSSIETLRERLLRFATTFAEGREWIYGIFTSDEARVLGGTGLHPRIGPAGLEIGYWLRADATGHGYGTEAVAALTGAAFDMPGVECVEIRCDPGNGRSAAIPRRLRYRHVRTLLAATGTAAGDRRTVMVWRITREEFRASGAALHSGRPPGAGPL